MELQYITRGKSGPEGKPRVYFSCHPADFETAFPIIPADILRHVNCTIWYDPALAKTSTPADPSTPSRPDAQSEAETPPDTPEDDDALTNYLWPIVREIIKTAVENKQNLIVEGCYVPFDWRQDFDEQYLPFIRFICLAMTRNYIENHFDDITGFESEIENRLIESDCTIAGLTEDNERYITGFRNAGERIVLIDSDYEQTIKNIQI